LVHAINHKATAAAPEGPGREEAGGGGGKWIMD